MPGIALGRYYDDATQRAGEKIDYEGERHLLMFGPNGSGKGTRFLIPNLLSIADRSILVRTHSVWLRLVVTSALRALYRPGGLRTLFMIDEMPALGHLGPLEDAFGLVRGYKVQIAGICQDLAQLKALYRERWESFLANAGVVQAFAPNDLTTADWLSKRAGQTTVIATAGSESHAAQHNRQNETASWSQVGRPLYLPDELMGFAEGSGVLFLAGMSHGVRFFAPPYWKIDQAEGRAAKNPYYQG